MSNSDSIQPDPPFSPAAPAPASQRRARWVYFWLWMILKNVIGWALILAAAPIGLVSPGPMGLPLFLIGFAMITFPGKRRLTGRMLRGKPFERHSPRWLAVEVMIAVGLPALGIWIAALGFSEQMRRHGIALVGTLYGLCIIASWILIHLGVRLANYGLTFAPAVRRKVRPWMRRHGINLLPPRRRRRLIRIHDSSHPSTNGEDDVDTGILEVDDRYQKGLKSFWTVAKPWVRRTATLVLLGAIFIWMGRKISLHWSEVKGHAGSISILNFVIAAFMFALFLSGVRAMSWRRILAGFGHPLPRGAAVRIWSTSELARYVPGAIWQIAGRVFLVRPYGVGMTECAASQVLELIIFLLANILVGASCLAFFGLRNFQGQARLWVLGLVALVPILAMLLHPRIFYGTMEWILRKLHRPALTNRLAGSELLKLLAWAIVGLLWQSVAIFLIVAHPLGLHWSKWYVVTGAYSLAWCAGFLVIYSPGGIGVREVIFVPAMMLAMPAYVRNSFGDDASLRAFLVLLGVVLRLWTIAGELIVWSVAYVADYGGANARPLKPANAQRDVAGANIGAGKLAG